MLQDFSVELAHKCNSPVIIFGATIGGMVVYTELKNKGFQVLFICDDYSNEEHFCGIPVLKSCNLQKYPHAPIILAVARSLESVCASLSCIENPIYTAKSLISHTDVDSFEDENKVQVQKFIEQYPIYVDQYNNSDVIFPILEVSITEHCTLRCRNCSHMIPDYKRPIHYDMTKIICEINWLLTCNIKISELAILGGEPFIHPNINELLDWVKEHRESFHHVTIITNGTVLPSASTVDLMRKAEVNVRISDYGGTSAKLSQLVYLCIQENIPFSVPKESWMDFGHGEKHGYTKEHLTEMVQICPFAQDYLLLNGYLYRCAHAAHLYNLGLLDQDDHEYVKIEVGIDPDVLKAKIMRIFSLNQLSACQYCNGPHFDKMVKPGVQKKLREMACNGGSK